MQPLQQVSLLKAFFPVWVRWLRYTKGLSFSVGAVPPLHSPNLPNPGSCARSLAGPRHQPESKIPVAMGKEGPLRCLVLNVEGNWANKKRQLYKNIHLKRTMKQNGKKKKKRSHWRPGDPESLRDRAKAAAAGSLPLLGEFASRLFKGDERATTPQTNKNQQTQPINRPIVRPTDKQTNPSKPNQP